MVIEDIKQVRNSPLPLILYLFFFGAALLSVSLGYNVTKGCTIFACYIQGTLAPIVNALSVILYLPFYVTRFFTHNLLALTIAFFVSFFYLFLLAILISYFYYKFGRKHMPTQAAYKDTYFFYMMMGLILFSMFDMFLLGLLFYPHISITGLSVTDYAIIATFAATVTATTSLGQTGVIKKQVQNLGLFTVLLLVFGMLTVLMNTNINSTIVGPATINQTQFQVFENNATASASELALLFGGIVGIVSNLVLVAIGTGHTRNTKNKRRKR